MGARKLSYYEEESLTKMTLFSKGGIRIFTKKSQKNRLDYYPFGMLLPNRHESTSEYRYGFNGKEKDDEVYGNGNVYDYGFRIYNPRLGKFLSMDPLTKSYPWYTPYQFAGNKPIAYIDLDGLEELKYTSSMGTMGENIEQVICNSDVLTQVYENVTDPTVENTTIYVGTVDYTEIGKSKGWNAKTFDNEVFLSMISTMSSFDKYKEDNKDLIALPEYQYGDQLAKQQELYNQYEKQFEAIGFTYKEIEEKIKSGEQLYAVLINKTDLLKIESSDDMLIEVVNSYIHELDAHIEEMLEGNHESAKKDHEKYFKGTDEDENEIIEGIITGETTSDGKPKSPSVTQYGTGSEAEKNYNAVVKAVETLNK
jgi:RHS repeat-associated protein